MKTVTLGKMERALDRTAFFCGILVSVLSSRFWLGFLLLCCRQFYRLIIGLALLCLRMRGALHPVRRALHPVRGKTR